METDTNTNTNSEKDKDTLQIRLDSKTKRDFKVWCSLNSTDMTKVLLPVIKAKVNELKQV